MLLFKFQPSRKLEKRDHCTAILLIEYSTYKTVLLDSEQKIGIR